MHIEFESGLALSIPPHHPVFIPLGDYESGDVVDPSTVDFAQGRAEKSLHTGTKIIVDNHVQVVATVRRID